MYRKVLADGLTVSARFGLDKFEALARQGVRLVINRSDGRARGQPPAAELACRHVQARFASLPAAGIDRFGKAWRKRAGRCAFLGASGSRRVRGGRVGTG